MSLKPQSIRKGIVIKVNNTIVEKEEIITLSNFWEEKHISFFKKMLKQGGKFKIINDLIEIIPIQQITNSKGEKHSNATVKSPGPDDRF
jgi:translation elongation factor P/translation initiation factor 5A